MSSTDGPVESDPTVTAPRNISLSELPEQCALTNVSWIAGQPPIRIEFYQADNTSAAWDTVDAGMFNIDYDEPVGLHSMQWKCNVAANKILWIVIVDHSGSYLQNQKGFVVQDSSNSECVAHTAYLDSGYSAITPLSAAAMALWLVSLLIACLLGYRLWRTKKLLRSYTRSSPRKRSTIDRDSASIHSILKPAKTVPFVIQTQDLGEEKNDERSPTVHTASPNRSSVRSSPPHTTSGYDQLASTVPGSNDTYTINTFDSPATDAGDIPLSRNDASTAAYTLDDDVYSMQDLTRQQSNRSSFAPSFQSSNAYSINTEATVASSNTSNGGHSTNGLQRSPSRRSQKSLQQFFSLRGDKNPFLSSSD